MKRKKVQNEDEKEKGRIGKKERAKRGERK